LAGIPAWYPVSHTIGIIHKIEMNPDITSFRICACCLKSRVKICPAVIVGGDKCRNVRRIIATGVATDIVVSANSVGTIEIAISGARASVRNIAIGGSSFFGRRIIETRTVIAASGMTGSAFFYKISVTSANLPSVARIGAAIGCISFFGIGGIETLIAGTASIMTDSGFFDKISITSGIYPCFAIICSAVSSLLSIGGNAAGTGIVAATSGITILAILFISAILTTALIPRAAGAVSAVFPNIIGSASASIHPISVIIVTN